MVTEIGRQITYQRSLIDQLGWSGSVRFRAAILATRLGWRGDEPIRMQPPSLLFPATLRLRSTDPDVYGQVISHEEYAPVVDPAARVIVDCGANIGLTSAWLLSRMLQARVIAIEPAPSNAAMCRRNLAPYGARAEVIEAAVWSCCTTLMLDAPPGHEWGARVHAGPAEGAQIPVRAIDLPSLGLDRIDILKIDIEGSERMLFAEGVERWLPHVGAIAIELHSEECERSFRSAMAGYRYTESRSGELMICRDITPSVR